MWMRDSCKRNLLDGFLDILLIRMNGMKVTTYLVQGWYLSAMVMTILVSLAIKMEVLEGLVNSIIFLPKAFCGPLL